MKNIIILGSTGSIGKNTLEVVRHFPDKFKVAGISANSNIDLLLRQIEEFRPSFAAVNDVEAAAKLKKRIGRKTKLFAGEGGILRLVVQGPADTVVIAQSGASALMPLLKAIDRGKRIALANKEALVIGGPLIMREAKKKKARIIPIDSEQSAIWQCLEGRKDLDLKRIYLTASGGPFRNFESRALQKVTVEQVLAHPKWKMGKKISVDSANLMNKGLELLEAMFLFAVGSERIKILIHPEALVHSMVEFVDGVVLAQLSATDMRIPIQYALSYPARLSNSLPCIDFYKLKELHFDEPDYRKFPCLNLCFLAAKELGTQPAVLNAANEVSVDGFLNSRIGFLDIPDIIEKVMRKHSNKKDPDLNDILAADSWARDEALKAIERIKC